MTVRRSLLTVALASLIALALPTPASADPHETSDPGQGTRLDSFPDEITVQFGVQITEPASISVSTVEGDIVAEDVEAVVDGREIVADVSDLDGSGSFRVSYTVTGPDQQPIVGQIDFDVADPADTEAGPGEEAAEEAAEDQGTNWRGILIIGIGVALGLAVIVISWRLLRGRPERDSLDEPLP